MATQLSFGPRFHPRSAPVTFWVIVSAVVVTALAFLSGLSQGASGLLTDLFVFQPAAALQRPWTLLLYPFLNLQQPFWFLLMAYVIWWCGTELERWWGWRVQLGFLLAVTISGGLFAMLATAVAPGQGGIGLSGAGIIMEALLCAWGVRHPQRQVILLFVPVTGLVIAIISCLGVWFTYGAWHGFFVMLGTCGLAALYVTKGEHFHRFLRRFQGDPQAREARRRDKQFQRIMAKSGLHLVDDDDEQPAAKR